MSIIFLAWVTQMRLERGVIPLERHLRKWLSPRYRPLRLAAVHHPRMKMKEEIPEGPTSDRSSEESGNGLHVVQTGSKEEGLHQVTSQGVKLEPEERQLQCWEAQLQEFLKKVESPPSGSENTEPPSEAEMSLVPSDVCQSQKETARLQPAFREGDPTGVQGSCQKVKEEVLRDETISTEVLRRRFRTFCYQEAGGPRAACSRLQGLCHSWLKPERRTKGQILELVILEQFLSILPLEIQSWVREGQPETCGHAVALAEEFLLRHGKAEREKRQVLGRFVELSVSFSEEEQTSLDPGQKHPCREIEQERNRDASFLGGEMLTSEQDKELQRVPSEKLKHEKEEEGCGNGDEPERQLPRTSKESPVSFTTADQMPLDTGERHPCREIKQESNGDTILYGVNLLVNECSKEPQGMLSHKSEGEMEGKICNNQDGTERQMENQTEEWKNKFVIGLGSSSCKIKAPERVYRGKTRSPCPVCGKIFATKSSVNRHQRIHTGEKPYKCSDCGKSFTQKTSLITHKVIHSDQKLYKCSDCGKSFKHKLSLIAHHSIHTGEKPYKCSVCRKSFTQRAHVSRHQRIHAREKQKASPNSDS
ncbi:zinc finger and SCAN domain-containing protein 12-like isoform X3 [Hemicordylus capensis]|uniref:zinc finger and SCAN domain-containing protein 12-like isoform X3 n=1 Tax=Hemicordylus capensis TaxID=884348 RepID=UPI002302BD93|nr:zinc finger and SCAN domain-containing protein 12-like isoform X3 [Hemicordylus capensis]